MAFYELLRVQRNDEEGKLRRDHKTRMKRNFYLAPECVSPVLGACKELNREWREKNQ